MLILESRDRIGYTKRTKRGVKADQAASLNDATASGSKLAISTCSSKNDLQNSIFSVKESDEAAANARAAAALSRKVSFVAF